MRDEVISLFSIVVIHVVDLAVLLESQWMSPPSIDDSARIQPTSQSVSSKQV